MTSSPEPVSPTAPLAHKHSDRPPPIVEEIDVFLAAIGTYMTPLRDRFIAAGVINNDYLRGLARLPPDAARQFLLGDVGLTQFEFYAVNAELQRRFL